MTEEELNQKDRRIEIAEKVWELIVASVGTGSTAITDPDIWRITVERFVGWRKSYVSTGVRDAGQAKKV